MAKRLFPRSYEVLIAAVVQIKPAMVRAKAFLIALSDKFSEDETTRLSAALAFYLSLSFAPIALLFIAISAGFDQNLVSSFDTQINALAGEGARDLFRAVVASSKSQSFEISSLTGLVGVVSLLVSSSVIFGELRADLNKIFGIRTSTENKSFFQLILIFLKERIAHIGLVLSFVILLIVSLIGSSLLSAYRISDEKLFVSILDSLISWIFYSGAFVLMIRYVPDERQKWIPALKGGILIATLFVLGKNLIGAYLGSSAIGSAYGAAGSGIVFLAWIYYSATIIFIGAEASALLAEKDKKVL